MSTPELVEGRDYYVDAHGLYVFTEAYLLNRGNCCGSGCLHCPYGLIAEGAGNGDGTPADDEPLKR